MQPTSLSSGKKTADAVIYDGRGILTGVVVGTDGTNDVTLTIYDDNTAATSNTILFEVVVGGADNHAVFDLGSIRPRCVNGLYADVTGTGASYIVYHG